MDDQRKCFTFIWKIKNFSFSFNYKNYFNSPVFFIHGMSKSLWRLGICLESCIFENSLACRLEKVSGPDNILLNYELSFLTSDRSYRVSETVFKKAFQRALYYDSGVNVKRDDVFVNKKNLFIPDDTLTICCKIWKSEESFEESVTCSVETQINIECKYVVGTIEKFSSLKTNSKIKVSIKSPEKEFSLSAMNLCINADGKLNIEIKSANYKPSAVYKFQVFVTDAFGCKVKSSRREMFDRHPFSMPLTFSCKYLIENKERYLPNDVLTLHCEVIFPKGHVISKELEKISDMTYDYDCEGIQSAIAGATNTNSSSEERHTESLTTLTDDLISLFNEGILYDIKLKTATETFPAHTIVLSARSSVFKSMLMADMREKSNKCVEIEDLNADTVRQMLSFMYKDTLENVDFESAKNLYFAADKYNIVSLKQKCSSFLKQSLLCSNCCDILLLADKHQDLELKKSVQDYIAENDEAVFDSDEWKNLEENHPRLTIEILRTLYMRKKKT